MLDEQVVADFVERIGIEAGRVRLGQALVEFKVENGEAQCLGGADFVRVSRETDSVMGVGMDQQSRGGKLRQHSNPISSCLAVSMQLKGSAPAAGAVVGALANHFSSVGSGSPFGDSPRFGANRRGRRSAAPGAGAVPI